ncbi:MAG TPA: tetratricopeptide repeat protein [Edaphobacter sp.]|nr:tetratricopeptide repeat protein [Edaphobacter sp.]
MTDGTVPISRLALVACAFLDLSWSRQADRAAVAAFLYGNSSSTRAAANLRQLLLRIRAWEEATGCELFSETGGVLTRSAAHVPSDVGLLLSKKRIRSAPELKAFIALYEGDFLSGVELQTDEARSWIAESRSRLREHFVETALSAVHELGTDDEILRRLAEEAPYDDRIVRAQMVAARSSSAKVRQIYDAYARRLQVELAGVPEPKTEALLVELAPRSWEQSFLSQRIDAWAPPASRASVPRVLILPPAEGLALLKPVDQVLGHSLIDEITHALSRMKTFAVFAPFTARQLAVTPFPQGNPYGANYLLTTRLLPTAGAAVRLTATLTSVETHEVLLSEEMRFVANDLGAHRYHLATGLASKVAGGIADKEMRQFRLSGSASAYVHYLLGAEAARTIELKPVRRAREHFKRALRLSPGFAPARAMLAYTYSWEWLLLDRREPAPLQKAVELASRAVQDDPLDPIGHRELGNAALYLDRTDEALEHLQNAVSLGPHYADVLFNYADLLMHLGRNDEAAIPMDTALELNPLAPDLYFWINGTIRYFLGDYQAASASFDRMKEKEAASRVMAAVEAMLGNTKRAHELRATYMARHPDFRLADFMIPLKSPAAREHYIEGLRRAGFH